MTKSYWQIKNKSLRAGTKQRPDFTQTFNIAIVGGGLVGISLAYFLKRLGCDRVIVLEKEFVGYGASGRNAGFLISGMAEPYSRLVVGIGRDSARDIMRTTIDNHALIAAAIDELKINCEYQKAGSYHLAVSEVEKRELLESTELLISDGFESVYIDSADLRARLGFGNYAGGHFNPGDGSLDPYAFVRGMADNHQVAEGFEVKSIRRLAGQVELAGDDWSLKAEMAILATNAYTPLLDAFFKELVFPVKGQMMATAPNTHNPLKTATYYANFGYDYFRQSMDETVLIGGLRDRFINTEIGYLDETTAELQDGLKDYLTTNIGIQSPAIEYRWSGLMGNTIDGLPLVGSLPHNSAVLAMVGCNGHGFGFGMVETRDLAQAIMGAPTSDLLKRFSIKRFYK